MSTLATLQMAIGWFSAGRGTASPIGTITRATYSILKQASSHRSEGLLLRIVQVGRDLMLCSDSFPTRLVICLVSVPVLQWARMRVAIHD